MPEKQRGRGHSKKHLHAQQLFLLAGLERASTSVTPNYQLLRIKLFFCMALPAGPFPWPFCCWLLKLACSLVGFWKIWRGPPRRFFRRGNLIGLLFSLEGFGNQFSNTPWRDHETPYAKGALEIVYVYIFPGRILLKYDAHCMMLFEKYGSKRENWSHGHRDRIEFKMF